MHETVAKLGRRNYTVLLKSMARVSQKRIAELLGVSEGTVSNFKDDHLARLCDICASAGLKLVPEADELVDAEEVKALRVLAMRQLERSGADSGFGSL